MPRSRGDKGAPKNTEASGKGKQGEVDERPPKAPEAGGPPGSPNTETQHGCHGRKNSKKGAGDPHAASTKAYSPFLNMVFGKVGAWGDNGWRGYGKLEMGLGSTGMEGTWCQMGTIGQSGEVWGLTDILPSLCV